tara:strand:- start:115 stop:420 length:306 start_codon:yes stop_codon:yes gene_type:complete
VDVINIIETLGIPVAVAFVLGYGCLYLMKFITGQLTSDLDEKFKRHENIMIKLIDSNNKERQTTLKHNVETYAKFDTLISLVTQLLNGVKKNGYGRDHKTN